MILSAEELGGDDLGFGDEAHFLPGCGFQFFKVRQEIHTKDTAQNWHMGGGLVLVMGRR